METLSELEKTIMSESSAHERDRIVTDFYIAHEDEILKDPEVLIKFSNYPFETLSYDEERKLKRNMIMSYFENNNPSLDDALFVLRGGEESVGLSDGGDAYYEFPILKLLSDDDLDYILERVKGGNKIVGKILDSFDAKDLEGYPNVIKFSYLNSNDNEFLSYLKTIADFAERDETIRINYLANVRGVKNVSRLVEDHGRDAVMYSLLNNIDVEEVIPELAELLLVEPKLKIAYMQAQEYGKMFEDVRIDIATILDDLKNLKSNFGIKDKDEYFKLLEDDAEIIFRKKYGDNPAIVLNPSYKKQERDGIDAYQHKMEALQMTYSSYKKFIDKIRVFTNLSSYDK